MKAIFISLLSLFVVLNSNAQVWGHAGATWHYQYGGLSLFDGTHIITYERDTVIDNFIAQVIQTRQQFIYPGPNGPYQGPTNIWLDYTRYSGDTVYWYKENQFFPLFDFGAQVGDSLIIHNDSGADLNCDSLSVLHVVAAGIETINGVDLRYIDVERGVNSNYGYNGRIHERMGSVSGSTGGYFWPTNFECDSGVYEYIQWQFNCYDDDSFDLYNPSGTACNPYQFVSLNELKSNSEEVVKMYDLTGREIENPKNELVIVFYSNGVVRKKFVE